MSEMSVGDQAAAPAVGQGGADGMVEQVAQILVVADVGAVQRLNHLPINATRNYALLFP
jgi:hypothetical protein